jgi:hypothetical protein
MPCVEDNLLSLPLIITPVFTAKTKGYNFNSTLLYIVSLFIRHRLG